MKRKPQVRKPAPTRSRGKVTVGLDAFGNALPALPASAGGGAVARVARTKEIVPATPRRRRSGGRSAVVAPAPGLLGRMVAWFRPRPAGATQATVEERLEAAFHALHGEFQRRERQLEERMEAIRREQQALAEQKARRLRWGIPLALVGAVVVGYALHVLTNMQDSMVAMSGNMGEMAGDTRSMAHNIETMNRSMAGLNGNVGQMTQQVGTISQAAAPMGQAAQSMAPMTGMFKSFWPF